jgi:hypothetical protein
MPQKYYALLTFSNIHVNFVRLVYIIVITYSKQLKIMGLW